MLDLTLKEINILFLGVGGRERGRESQRKRQNKTISEGQKYNFSRLLLRALEQEIDGFKVMGVTGKEIIIFWTKMG